jgi:hypothetical protein
LIRIVQDLLSFAFTAIAFSFLPTKGLLPFRIRSLLNLPLGPFTLPLLRLLKRLLAHCFCLRSLLSLPLGLFSLLALRLVNSLLSQCLCLPFLFPPSLLLFCLTLLSLIAAPNAGGWCSYPHQGQNFNAVSWRRHAHDFYLSRL